MKQGQEQIREPLVLFYCFASQDESLLELLKRHLSTLRRQNLITELHTIPPGADRRATTSQYLMSADLVLLLVTSSFMDDEVCSDQLELILERERAGLVKVVPLLFRPVDWRRASFAHLQVLPRNHRPVSLWKERDEAFTAITGELRTLIEAFHPVHETYTHSPSAYTPRSLQVAGNTALSPRQRPLAIPPRASSPIDLNRHRMLDRVQAVWVKGLLEHSLQREILIELGLDHQPNALANPWQLMVQESDLPAHPLPAGTTIPQVYDEAGGSLLILGAPGAGKTTLLLDLASHLLLRARDDESFPIPAYFLLSSWAARQETLADWLVVELQDKYHVPRQPAQTWIEQDQLLLLLDGLDEVAPAARSLCIQAINRYRQEHPSVSVVVCSRSADYLQGSARLSLDRAVTIQPLTDEQIEHYLFDLGTPVDGLREVIQHDEELRELARAPLMLSIMILAYQQQSSAEISSPDRPAGWQQHLFPTYVQRMFGRRTAIKPYSDEQTIHWLSALARQMKARGQTIFTLESLQPEVLSPPHQKIYDWLAVHLPAVLMGIAIFLAVPLVLFRDFGSSYLFLLMGGVMGWLFSRSQSTTRHVDNNQSEQKRKQYLLLSFRLLFLGLIGTIIGILFYSRGYALVWLLTGKALVSSLPFTLSLPVLSWLLERLSPDPLTHSETLGADPRSFWLVRLAGRLRGNTHGQRALLVGGFLGIGDILSFILNIGPYWLDDGLGGLLSFRLLLIVVLELFYGLSYGLIAGLSGLLLSLALGSSHRTVYPTERLVWSWNQLKHSLFSLQHFHTVWRISLLIGVLGGLREWMVIWVGSGLNVGAGSGLIYGLTYGLSVGLSYWILFGLFRGIVSVVLDESTRLLPNQGIHRSFWNALLLTCLSGIVLWGTILLSYGLSFGLLSRLYDQLSYGLRSGPVIACCGGVLVWFLRGGLAWWRHWVIRWLLVLAYAAPRRYIHFLDYTVERILLHRVGGGYIFIHRLLLDYFVGLESSGSSVQPSSEPASARNADG